MQNFEFKKIYRGERLSAYALIPQEGYVLCRKSDDEYKSEYPVSFPASENIEEILDDFFAVKE